jgi:hypothetical protein
MIVAYTPTTFTPNPPNLGVTTEPAARCSEGHGPRARRW